VRGQEGERGGPGDMSDEGAAGYVARRIPDFGVRHTQQDAVGVMRTSLATGKRAGDLLEAGVA
jgi:hypothetical protein